MFTDLTEKRNRHIVNPTKLLAALAVAALAIGLPALPTVAAPDQDPAPSTSTSSWPDAAQVAPLAPTTTTGPSAPTTRVDVIPDTVVDDVGGPTTDTTTAAPDPASESARAITALTTDPVTLDRGHVDVVSVRPDGSELELGVKDDTSGGAVVWRDPSSVTFFVPERAAIAVPDDSAFAFLGAPGQEIWLLPQVQEPDLLWTGWNTEEIPAGFLTTDSVQWRLVGANGPGAFAIFTTDSFGSPNVIFDSDDAVPDEISLPIGVHAHANWAFGAKGTYDLTFDISATLSNGGPRTLRATIRFNVVEVTSTAPIPPLSISNTPSGDLAASSAGGAAGATGATSASGAGRGSGSQGAPLPASGSTTGLFAAIGVALVIAGALLVRAAGRRPATAP